MITEVTTNNPYAIMSKGECIKHPYEKENISVEKQSL